MDFKEMSKEELTEIIGRAEAELLSRDKPSTQLETYFYSALISSVKGKGGKTVPLSVYKDNKGNKTLLKNTHSAFDKFINTYAGKKLSIVEYHALYKFLITLCIDVMEKRGAAITTTSVLAYTQNYVQDIFNSQYPFWLENGMFPLFVKMVLKNEDL